MTYTPLLIVFDLVCASRTKFLCLLPVLISANLATAAEFIPLGTLPGTDIGYANGVSDDGLVVTGSYYSEGPSHNYYAFRWTDSTGLVAVGVLPNKVWSSEADNGKHPLSEDGSTIVGQSGTQIPGFGEIFYYSEGRGVRSLGEIGDTFQIHDVSADGSVFVGNNGDYDTPAAYRWTEVDGPTPLGSPPGDRWSQATFISDKGNLVVGFSGRDDVLDDTFEIFKWTEADGMVGTGIYVDNHYGQIALASNDGSVIASSSYLSSPENAEAFYWTQETGTVPLGWLPVTGSVEGVNSEVRDMTPDGRLIVGWSGEPFSDRDADAFVWTEEGGMEKFQDVLVDQYGLGDALQGWRLTSINSVSSNGQFFAGYSNENPTGNLHAPWVVRLDAPWGTVPEPATAALALVAFVPLVVLQRWKSEAANH